MAGAFCCVLHCPGPVPVQALWSMVWLHSSQQTLIYFLVWRKWWVLGSCSDRVSARCTSGSWEEL